MKKVKKLQKWKPLQLKWLERIEKQLLKEYIIDKESFESGAFKSKGGYAKIDKHLDGKLDEIIIVLNDNLYKDRETA